MYWSLSFVLGLPLRVDFYKYSKYPWNMIQLMPCGNPCRRYIYLAFTYSVGSSSIVCSKPGPAPPFPPMRVLEVQWSRVFNLVCDVALRYHIGWLMCGPNSSIKPLGRTWWNEQSQWTKFLELGQPSSCPKYKVRINLYFPVGMLWSSGLSVLL